MCVLYKCSGVRLVSDTSEEFNTFLPFQFLKSSVLNDELLFLIRKLPRFKESEILRSGSFITNGFVKHCSSSVIVS